MSAKTGLSVFILIPPRDCGAKPACGNFGKKLLSYKIVVCALMKHINNDSQINVPLSPSIDPCSGVMNAPQRLAPEQMPDPMAVGH